jgi:hypothetical protein
MVWMRIHIWMKVMPWPRVALRMAVEEGAGMSHRRTLIMTLLMIMTGVRNKELGCGGRGGKRNVEVLEMN